LLSCALISQLTEHFPQYRQQKTYDQTNVPNAETVQCRLVPKRQPLPLAGHIPDRRCWRKVEATPTDGITPLFNNVTMALEVIPNKINNPPTTLERTM